MGGRCGRGSLAAFSRLVAMFEARLFNVILRKVGSRTEAEDITQETFLRAWRRIGSYRARWRFSTWLYTIAARLAISHARQASRRLHLSNDGDRASPVVEGPREECGWIWKIVDEALTPEQREAVWLRYVEDMAIGEIAVVMGKSDVGVRVMLFRARAVLAQKLGDRLDAIATQRDADPVATVVKAGVGRRVAEGVQ